MSQRVDEKDVLAPQVPYLIARALTFAKYVTFIYLYRFQYRIYTITSLPLPR